MKPSAPHKSGISRRSFLGAVGATVGVGIVGCSPLPAPQTTELIQEVAIQEDPFPPVPTHAVLGDVYVSLVGTPAGDGSRERPLDLITALAGAVVAAPARVLLLDSAYDLIGDIAVRVVGAQIRAADDGGAVTIRFSGVLRLSGNLTWSGVALVGASSA